MDSLSTLVVDVRASTDGFAADIGKMRGSFDSIVVDGFSRGGDVLERSLLGAIRRGSLGFEDLRRTGLRVIELDALYWGKDWRPVLTDDQGYGDISAHGNPILKTPNMDRLRAEGARFTDFHVSPTCAPTSLGTRIGFRARADRSAAMRRARASSDSRTGGGAMPAAAWYRCAIATRALSMPCNG